MLRKIRYIIVFTVSLLVLIINGHSQELKLKRTDVDATRSSFVTATYIFGIDVVVDSLKRSNGVTFELHYTKADSVILSGTQIIGFGPNATSIVIPIIDTLAQSGVIFVGVLSGDTIGVHGYDNPSVIHLEFAVSPSCRNVSDLIFRFENAQAVVNTDSGGKIVNIKSSPVTYKVHGFIDVWPGDADGNGITDIKDVSKIGLYLGFGSFLKPVRSFKRHSASTNWFGQSVLGWDSLDVTFADCDGNGDITVTDMLIIALNFNKTHNIAQKESSAAQSLEEYHVIAPPGSISVPIYVNPSEEFIGATATIDLTSLPDDAKFIGFTKSDIFEGKSFIFGKISEVEKTAQLVVGAAGQGLTSKDCSILAYAVIEPGKHSSTFQPILREAMGMTSSGFLFPMEQALSVNEENGTHESQIIIRQNMVYLKISDMFHNSAEISIFDISGNLITKFNSMNSISEINLLSAEQLCSGTYFVQISDKSISELVKFVINR